MPNSAPKYLSQTTTSADEKELNCFYCSKPKVYNCGLVCRACLRWYHGTCVHKATNIRLADINKTEWTCELCTTGPSAPTSKKSTNKASNNVARPPDPHTNSSGRFSSGNSTSIASIASTPISSTINNKNRRGSLEFGALNINLHSGDASSVGDSDDTIVPTKTSEIQDVPETSAREGDTIRRIMFQTETIPEKANEEEEITSVSVTNEEGNITRLRDPDGPSFSPIFSHSRNTSNLLS